MSDIEKPEIIATDDGREAIVIPDGFELKGCRVVTTSGRAFVVTFQETQEATSRWPEGFFEQVRIGDDCFVRPAQGEVPDAPSLGNDG